MPSAAHLITDFRARPGLEALRVEARELHPQDTPFREAASLKAADFAEIFGQQDFTPRAKLSTKPRQLALATAVPYDRDWRLGRTCSRVKADIHY